MPRKPKYYWDSGIFIAWIIDEKVPPCQPGEMEGLAEIVDEIDSGKAILITSVVTTAEVLEGNLTAEQKKRYELVLQRPSTIRMNVDLRVSELSGEIRDYYRQRNIRLELADSIHLGTAILTKADELHTFDDKLLRFDGNVAGNQLKICRPKGKQIVMRF